MKNLFRRTQPPWLRFSLTFIRADERYDETGGWWDRWNGGHDHPKVGAYRRSIGRKWLVVENSTGMRHCGSLPDVSPARYSGRTSRRFYNDVAASDRKDADGDGDSVDRMNESKSHP
ncbi:hypothetical protein ACTOB_007079 [Actinoplanes oblitus]|uniref:Uncharacterized protein n=1 Tax=Actinoplanes oblitus TaxID=3040509 RepID=A0ABY8WBI1_9ACTN|nr:hypothetical protein [Actinoplanes oblitus]WIM95018.1 hypothetical protein ACTOB_007079 [Actinoplanes oblitus]